MVILLSGRFAGRKGIIIKSNDEGTTDRPYGHCLVAGIDRYPRQVKKGMSKKKIARRTRIKPFVRVSMKFSQCILFVLCVQCSWLLSEFGATSSRLPPVVNMKDSPVKMVQQLITIIFQMM